MKKVRYNTVSYDRLPQELREVVANMGKDPVIQVAREGNSQYILIGLGERPTGGYDVAIESVKHEEGKVFVTYREVAPQPGAILIQVITYPWKAIKIDHSLPVEVRRIS